MFDLIMMPVAVCVVMAAIGFGLTVWAFHRDQPDEQHAWIDDDRRRAEQRRRADSRRRP